MLKSIIDNKGGTLNKDLTRADITHGYMVSLSGTEERSKSLTMQVLSEYAKHVVRGFVGVWFNDKDNLFYLDNSVNILEYEHALALARKHKQLAIYDVVNNKVIEI